tara:strand:+ start:3776 stop:4897 length:1122 start_codon:yes stop_codon:yes gene_type:complete
MRITSAFLTTTLLLAAWWGTALTMWQVNLLYPSHWTALWRAVSVLQFDISGYSNQLLGFLCGLLFVVIIGIPACAAIGALWLTRVWSTILQSVLILARTIFKIPLRCARVITRPLAAIGKWSPPIKVRARVKWGEEPIENSDRIVSEEAEPVMQISAESTRISYASEETTDDFAVGLQTSGLMSYNASMIPTIRDYLEKNNYECRLDIALNSDALGDRGFTPDEFGNNPKTSIDMVAFGSDQIIIIQILDLGNQTWTASTSIDQAEWQSQDGERAPCPVFRAAAAMRRFKQQYAGSLNLQPGELVAVAFIGNGKLDDNPLADQIYDYATSMDVEIAMLDSPGALESLFVYGEAPYPLDKIDLVSAYSHNAKSN